MKEYYRCKRPDSMPYCEVERASKDCKNCEYVQIKRLKMNWKKIGWVASTGLHFIAGTLSVALVIKSLVIFEPVITIIGGVAFLLSSWYVNHSWNEFKRSLR